MTVPTYGAECPYCAQVVHVADVAAAVEALRRHILAGTDERCAYWPDRVYRRLRIRHARRIKRRRWILEDIERDLGYCAYYRGLGTCSGGAPCMSPDVAEPCCVTCEPAGGWPSTRYIALGELDYQPVTIERP